MIDATFGAASTLHAHLAQFSQDTRLLRLATSLGANHLLVEQIEGREALSQGYRFTITALCTDAHLDLAALLGQPALLQILTSHSLSTPHPFHGHVTAFERLSSEGGFARYRITLEPWLAFLRHRRDSHIPYRAGMADIVATHRMQRRAYTSRSTSSAGIKR